MKSKKSFWFVIIALVFLSIPFRKDAYASRFTADLVITSPQEHYAYRLKVLDDKIRQCEFANWINSLVKPSIAKRRASTG